MPWVAVKHGHHNQATHGRKGRAGQAGAAAYSAARAGGASVTDARAAARTAVQETRAQEKAAAQAARVKKLTDQAAHYRKLTEGNATEAQKRRYAERAAALEARARGERVGKKETPEERLEREVMTPSAKAQEAMSAVLQRDAQVNREEYNQLRKEQAVLDHEEYQLLRQQRALTALETTEGETWNTDPDIAQQKAIIMQRIADMEKKQKRLSQQIEYAEENMQQFIRQPLENPNPARALLSFNPQALRNGTFFPSQYTPERQKEIQTVQDQVMRLTTRQGMDGVRIEYTENYYGNHPSIRPFAAPNRGSINLDPSTRSRTIAHELGHHIEELNPDIATRARAFLDARTKGETPQKMRDITRLSSYHASEVATPDRFISPYMGKRYPDGATEIISMGIEYFYSDPVRLARDDPEYFMFLYDTLNP